MSAVQESGTPAAEAGEATAALDAATNETTGDTLLDALSSYKPEDEEKTDPDSPDAKKEDEKEKKPEPEKPQAKAKRTRAELEAFLLSEENTKTPEGREKARDYFRGRQSKLDGIDIRLQEKGARLAREKEAAQNWFQEEHTKLETDRAYARKLAGLRSKLEDPADMGELLNAIGELTRKDGREVWENWAKFAVQGGKRGEPSAGERAAKAEIETLRSQVQALAERLERAPTEQQEAAERAEMERLSPEVQRLEKETIDEASDAEKYPVLAQYSALEAWHKPIVESVAKLRREARQNGKQLDRSAALAIVNDRLSRKAPTGAKPVSPRGETPTAPEVVRASSIAPSQARSMPAVRDKTEDELAEDLARDTNALERILGVSLSI